MSRAATVRPSATDPLAAYAAQSTLPGKSGRLARWFGLRDPDRVTDLELADLVSRGLDLAAVATLKPVLDLIAQDALYEVVSEPTIRRARIGDARLKSEVSERLYRISRIIDEAALLYRGDGDAMADFLRRPNQALDGRSPFSVASASSAGADLVIELVRAARAGVPL